MHAAESSPAQNAPADRPAPTLRQRLLRGLRKIAIAYLIIVLAMLLLENRLIFQASKFPAGHWQPTGLTVEDAEFHAADGTQIHGWFVPHPQPRAIILFAHGNAGNITNRQPFLEDLRRLGAATLIFDYRGYGKSDGSANEAGILQDARAARTWLAQRTGVAEGEIVLLGESLGGGVMVDLAQDGAAGLILMSTFTSMPDVAAGVYWWLPVRWLMRTQLNSLEKIAKFPGPVLQIHGDRDRLIPLANARTLHAAIPDPHKEFHVVPEADHNYLWPAATKQAIGRLLDRLPAPILRP